MKSRLYLYKVFACILLLAKLFFCSMGQDSVINTSQPFEQTISSMSIESPYAIPLLTPEGAKIANNEALQDRKLIQNIEEKKKENNKALNKRIAENKRQLDFGWIVLYILFAITPFSIVINLLQRKKRHIEKPKKTTVFSYTALLLLIPLYCSLWISFYTQNENCVFFELITIQKNDIWDIVDNNICKKQIKSRNAFEETVIVDSVKFEKLDLDTLKAIAKEDNSALYFSKKDDIIFLPSAHTNKDVHIYVPKRIYGIAKYVSDINTSFLFLCCIILFWIITQIRINKGIRILTERVFLRRCLLVCLFSVSFLFAESFWLSCIPLEIPPDGSEYIFLSSFPNIFMKCIYSHRTPGYPLFLSVINMFSPVSFRSVIFFQSLIYLFSLSWLLYELYKKNVPLILIVACYFLFYNFMSRFFFYVMCESLELSAIALLTAIGLRLSDAIENKRWFSFIAYLVITTLLCFFSMMIKPFPGLLLLPSGMVFFCLFFSTKKIKLFLYALLIGVISVLLPATYCTIRWSLCGDWNFASLINVLYAGDQLTLATPQSLNADYLRPEQKELASEIIHFIERNSSEMKWPLCNIHSPYDHYSNNRNKVVFSRGRSIYSFFGNLYANAPREEREKYKSSTVYTNAKCRSLFNVADPAIEKRMSAFYSDKLIKLYTTNPLWISAALSSFNPFKSTFYFHLTVSLPLLIFLLIATIPQCKRIRFGSWKTLFIFVALSIPLISYFGINGAYHLLRTHSFSNNPFGIILFEGRSEMVMFFSTLLGTILLSMYCIYSLIISLILAMRLGYLKYAPARIKLFFNSLVRK